MHKSQLVKEFYSELKFPGPYSIENLEFYDLEIVNNYLKFIDNRMPMSGRVLDVGCGSGFIINFLARRHPHLKFDAIDFSDSIDYADNFSQKVGINNITYIKEDFLKWKSNNTYDLILCNGVLHHIPEYLKAIKKIKKLAGNKIIVGIYNYYGKLAKKIINVKFRNNVLYKDQVECPFELTFTDNEFRLLFLDYKIDNIHPSVNNRFVDPLNLFNYNNGGLTLYCFLPG